MAVNNLRVIYNNLVESATITASSSQTSNPIANITKSQKSRTWRSQPTTISSATVKANLIIDLATAKSIGGLVLAFTNLVSTTASIKVTGCSTAPSFAGTVDAPTVTLGTQVWTQTVNCCPYNIAISSYGQVQSGANPYAYGAGTHARAWFSSANQALTARYIVIEITDTYTTAATGRYIEVASLVVGAYWSPKHNLSIGASSQLEDLSNHERTESGDLLTRRGPRFNKISLSLDVLVAQDRLEMSKILLNGGIIKPIFISCFPDNSDNWERERLYQVYGKLSQIPGLENFALDYYKTSLDIEEV